MITCQCAEAMRTYASQSSYLTPIPDANIDRGVIPLDSLPADWWNWLWQNITLNEGYIVQFINSVFSEINAVLSAAGVSPSTASTTDLRDAIQALAQVVATASVPGSVLSSTLSGKLNVIADGTATINGLGTPSDLQTTATNVVSAINEVLTLASGKAPISHASSNDTYGVGTTQQFGHVKVTEGCGLAICDGTISLNAPGYNCLGNVTTICFNGNTYTPTDGVIDLGSQTVSVDCMCQRAITSSTSGDFYSLLGGGLCRNTTGVDTVNLTGLAWNPVVCSLDWLNQCHNIVIGGNAGAACYGIVIGYGASLDYASYPGSCGVAIGNMASTRDGGIAIGNHACNGCVDSVALGPYAVADCACSVAIGHGAWAKDSQRGVAIGANAFVNHSRGTAIGAGAVSIACFCNGVNLNFSIIGDMYSLKWEVIMGDQCFTYGDYAKILQCVLRCCYTGRYASCSYIYLSGGAGIDVISCIPSSPSFPASCASGNCFSALLAPYACATCSRWVDMCIWVINIGWSWVGVSCTNTNRMSGSNRIGQVSTSIGAIHGV